MNKKAQGLKDTIEENMDSGKSYKMFGIFLGIGCLFLFLAFLFLPTVILSPHKFAMLFSIGSMWMLISMAFFRGPATYTKRLFRRDQALFSISYLVSLFLTLYCSIIMDNYILTILSCAVQVSFWKFWILLFQNISGLIRLSYRCLQCCGSYFQDSQEVKLAWKHALKQCLTND